MDKYKVIDYRGTVRSPLQREIEYIYRWIWGLELEDQVVREDGDGGGNISSGR